MTELEGSAINMNPDYILYHKMTIKQNEVNTMDDVIQLGQPQTQYSFIDIAQDKLTI